jgi:hypothetical protein
VDTRRVLPVAVAAVVVGILVLILLSNRGDDAASKPVAGGASGDARREAFDPHAPSGKDEPFTEGAEPRAAGPAPSPAGGRTAPVPGAPEPSLPPGHPVVPSGPGPGGPSAPPPAPTPVGGRGDGGGTLPVTYAPPSTWTEKAASGMRKAQWTLAAEGSGEGGEVVIFYFDGGGGGATDNIRRWEGQFEGSAKVTTKTTESGGLKVTRVDIGGTYTGSGMPGTGPGPKKPDWRMLGAILEGPGGMVFVKATAPAAVMAREEAAFDAFLGSFRAKP